MILNVHFRCGRGTESGTMGTKFLSDPRQFLLRQQMCCVPPIFTLTEFSCGYFACALPLNRWYELGCIVCLFSAQVTMRSDRKHCIIHHSVILGFEWGCSDWMGLWVGFVGKEEVLCVGEERWNGHLVIERMAIMCSRNSTSFLLPATQTAFLSPLWLDGFM